MSAIVVAIHTHSHESLKLLIAAKANVNDYSRPLSPLRAAGMYRNEPATRILLEAKAEVNGTHKRGEPIPLTEAVMSGSLGACRLLIEAKADLAHRHMNDAGMLRVAAQDLAEACELSADNPTQLRIMQIPQDQLGVLRLLLEHKADVNARDSMLQSPLMIMARNGMVPGIRLLVEAQADINIRDSTGLSPIFHSINKFKVAGVRALIELKADVNHVASPPAGGAAGEVGALPLTFAIERDSADAVDALIEGKADVNLSRTCSILDEAIRQPRKNERIVSALMRAGAKPWVQLATMRSVLTLGAYTGNEPMVAMGLRGASDAEKEVALVLAVAGDKLRTTRMLLGARANPSCTHGGMVPVMQAVFRGRMEMLQALLDAGADASQRVCTGETPVQLAAKMQRREMVALLMAKVKEQKKK
jgi:ankyrin repeat protein